MNGKTGPAGTGGKRSGGRSKGDSFLARQAKAAKKTVTEEELSGKEITPEDVTLLEQATKEYLCTPAANVYNIEFTRFKIRDMDSQEVLFEVNKLTDENENQDNNNPEKPEPLRFVRYQFPVEFLSLKRVGATIEFTVGDKPVNKFRMIERHFFRTKCLKSVDFDFGYCIPGSKNTCEHIYDMPQLTAEEISELVDNPYETKSDSFYFVDNKLVMHNKADYAYIAASS